MNLETTRLKLEPYNDSHYEGLRVMDNDSEVMRYINKGIVKNARRDQGKYKTCSVPMA